MGMRFLLTRSELAFAASAVAVTQNQHISLSLTFGVLLVVFWLQRNSSCRAAVCIFQTILACGRSLKWSTIMLVWKQMKDIFGHVWPKENSALQVRLVMVLLLITSVRLTTIMQPYCSKLIVNSLSLAGSTIAFRWDLIVAYSCLLLWQNSLFYALQRILWVPYEQFAQRQLRMKFFDKMHSLSLRWHLSRKTGEIIKIMDSGTNGIQELLWWLLFNIIPIIADIVTAIVVLTATLSAWLGCIVFVTLLSYFGLALFTVHLRGDYRQKSNRLLNDLHAKAVDSLLNFETVKYYNAEQYEANRYKQAIVEYETTSWMADMLSTLNSFLQSVLIEGSFLAASLLCAYMITQKQNNFAFGDYVLFGVYIRQLLDPLHNLGYAFRSLQNILVDTRKMFQLLDESEEIKDVAAAPKLIVKEGKVEFKNVSFYYLPAKKILNNISFVINPGQTVALVGPSGAGKSTVLRLLFRLYDVSEGQILWDEQDISQVQQRALREHIGIVPQDTVLFNDTIRYNIRYGKMDATDAEVEQAASAAGIHDSILTFPEKYEAVVGERGLKLSGGEKQRVAIARTILKAPNLILLDEATSALDTETERHIQASLNQVCKGRTTIIIAHRLSTVIHADEILVLKEGEIIERGKHEDLLAKQCVYAEMWKQQLQRTEVLEILEKTAAVSSNKRVSQTAITSYYG